jgi:hypothetical protein
MRFGLGQVFECSEDGRQAIVTQVRNEGREGLLRFIEIGTEEWFLWVELHQAGKWRLSSNIE